MSKTFRIRERARSMVKNAPVGRLVLFVVVALLGIATLVLTRASSANLTAEAEAGQIAGRASVIQSGAASNGNYVAFGSQGGGDAYVRNLQKIKAQPWRNTNEDDSPYKNWPMSQIDRDISVLFGPKQAYADGGFGEDSLHLDPDRGNMRTGCEFSHFSYDDPIVYPGQPEAAHLHMFFGNTDTNAYSTWDTIYNSGGGTCNGGELNRTGYWVPAMFDQNGNVRIPHFMNIYYKHENFRSQPQQRIVYYPDNPQIVAPNIAATANATFYCIDELGGSKSENSNFIDGLKCPGGLMSNGAKRYFEHGVLFQNCWNGQNPADTRNFKVSDGFFGGVCPSDFPRRLPNLRYLMRYTVEPGDDTSKWYLSSDVDKNTGNRARGGSTNHGDWWGAWNKQINKTFVDKCNNVLGASCGYGYMDAKSLQEAPNGPAMRYREKIKNFQNKVRAQDVYNSLCSHARPLQKTEQAAYCRPQ